MRNLGGNAQVFFEPFYMNCAVSIAKIVKIDILCGEYLIMEMKLIKIFLQLLKFHLCQITKTTKMFV